MVLQITRERADIEPLDIAYLRRRVVEEAGAAANAQSLQATLIHVALSTAYAQRCCQADDRAWVAEHRVW